MGSKILIIDHKDSYTYNLVQLFHEVGAEDVKVLSYTDLDLNHPIVADAIILSPGPGQPQEYPKSLALIDRYKGHIPILGVCMGLQLITLQFGGSLINLSRVKHGQKVNIYTTAPDISFRKITMPTPVGLYHSWAMNRRTKPDALQITATLEDQTVMAIQHRDYPIKAVQFHPESYMTEAGHQMAANWLEWIQLTP